MPLSRAPARHAHHRDDREDSVKPAIRKHPRAVRRGRAAHRTSAATTMPAMLKPLVTKPNTLPKAPGGVTSRTIMSRDGITMPVHKPAQRHHQDQQDRAEVDAADQDAARAVTSMLDRRDQAMSLDAAGDPAADQHADRAQHQVAGQRGVGRHRAGAVQRAERHHREVLQAEVARTHSSMKNTKFIRIGAASSSRQLVSAAGASSRGFGGRPHPAARRGCNSSTRATIDAQHRRADETRRASRTGRASAAAWRAPRRCRACRRTCGSNRPG